MPVKTNHKTKSRKLTFGKAILYILIAIVIVTVISFWGIYEKDDRTFRNFLLLFGGVSVSIITLSGVIAGIYSVFKKLEQQRETFENKPLIPFTLAEMKERFGEFGSKVTWIDRGVSKVGDLRIHGRLVISGPMKIGKTREAYELIRRAVKENVVSEARLYRLNPSYFDLIQDENITFPSDLDREQPLLILIDDFPFHYPPAKLEKLGTFLLILTCCKQVYLIATARIDQLTDEHKTWLPVKKFQPIKMLDLDEGQTRSLVDNASGVYGLQMETEARELFVKKNDGTPQLPLMAMQRLRANGTMQVDEENSSDVMAENIAEQWLATRRYIEDRHSSARYIFESLITFSQAKVPALRYFVFQYAFYLWKQDKSQKGNHKEKTLEESLRYLEHFGIVGVGNWFLYPDYVVESNHGNCTDIDGLGKFLLRHRWFMANRLLRRIYPQSNKHAWALLDFLDHNINTKNEKLFDQYAKQICHRWNDPNLLFSLGCLFMEQDRFKKAEDIFRNVITLDPLFTGAYGNIGICLRETNKPEKAEEMWYRVIEIDPSDEKAYYNLGSLFVEKLKFQEAEWHFRKVIEIDPLYIFAYGQLGSLFQDQNKLSEAEKLYRKVIEISPLDVIGHYNLGLVFHKQKQYSKAEEKYQQVLQIEPNDSDSYYGLACLESLCGNTDKAFKYLQKAFDLGYKDREWACKDSDFDNICNDPRFEQIVGCADLKVGA